MAVVLRGRLHRTAYFPGGTLKFEVSVLATPAQGGEMLPYDESALPALFKAAQHVTPAGPAVGVQVLAVQLYGVCSADGTWINDINEFGDPLSGAAPEPPDPDGKEAEGWLQWLVGTNGEKAHPSRPAAASGAPLPAPAYGKRNSNYHFVFRTGIEELMPGETKLVFGQARRFVCQVDLPPGLPPSYTGHTIRYVYYVWCSATVRTPGGDVRQHELRIPFRVCNPVASLRPVRPPFVSPMWEYRWKAREVALADDSARHGHAALMHPPEDACRSPAPAALGSTTAAYAVVGRERTPLHGSEGFVDSPATATWPNPEAPAVHSPLSRDAPPSPSSELGELLRGDEVDAGDPAPPASDAPPSPFVDVYAAVDRLLSAPKPLRETPVCPAGSSTPFCFVLTHQQHLCIGDTVTGVVRVADDPEVDFVRLAVRLEYDERVPVQLFKQGTHMPQAARVFSKDSATQTQTTQTFVVDESEEAMCDCAETSFEFVVAAHHPTSLYTDKVTVEWYLRFEFVCAPLGALDAARAAVHVDCLGPVLWELPLQVHLPPTECKSKKAGQYVYAT
eukprot:TRINITY_DN26877_c0_g1_i2.p1 TRINITY_DN26877_c0_g1~~TRINITY_DN26877_c0_g1_i2.p1  ORF type:complete len:579 (+),score=152.00 TRINITY_DN26877_c0_g1_i2:53-1738(+)